MVNKQFITTQKSIAVALGVSQARVSILKKKGMPLDSVASAKAWRESRSAPMVNGQNQPTQKELAAAMDMTRANVTRLKKQGMPVDSVASAQAWRESRKNDKFRKRAISKIIKFIHLPLYKVCSKCKAEKTLADFYKNKKTGYFMSCCKICFSEYANKKKIKKQKDRLKQREKIIHECETIGIVCKKCGNRKNKNEFPTNKGNITGRDGTCRDCQADKEKRNARNRYEKNKDHIKAKVKQYTEKNRDEVNKRARSKKAKMREEIAPLYVKHLLRIKAKDITDEMLKLKTEQIAIKRLSRQIKHVLKEEKNETSANTH